LPEREPGADPRLAIPDAEIASRIREGDALLFGRLFDAYWIPLTRFAAIYTQSDDEAQDVAAQVFASLWEGRERWHPASGVAIYLYSAVRHRTKNVFRAAQRFERNVLGFASAGESPTSGTPLLRADESVVADERRAIILRVVNGLPARPREVLLLRWLRGLEFGEIAALLRLSSNAVHVTYHRAVAQLRKQPPSYFE
jgi:RNA polymerase sigma-70 factor (ECF subfamily)